MGSRKFPPVRKSRDSRRRHTVQTPNIWIPTNQARSSACLGVVNGHLGARKQCHLPEICREFALIRSRPC